VKDESQLDTIFRDLNVPEGWLYMLSSIDGVIFRRFLDGTLIMVPVDTKEEIAIRIEDLNKRRPVVDMVLVRTFK
jgi:hypothetical protein